MIGAALPRPVAELADLIDPAAAHAAIAIEEAAMRQEEPRARQHHVAVAGVARLHHRRGLVRGGVLHARQGAVGGEPARLDARGAHVHDVARHLEGLHPLGRRAPRLEAVELPPAPQARAEPQARHSPARDEARAREEASVTDRTATTITTARAQTMGRSSPNRTLQAASTSAPSRTLSAAAGRRMAVSRERNRRPNALSAARPTRIIGQRLRDRSGARCPRWPYA